MKVRAKFACNSIELFAGGTKAVKLSPVYPGQDATKEDRAFWSATPSGHLSMTITNPATADFFEIGEVYYLTFEAAPAPATPKS